jgi:hypothetical protein
LINLVVKSYNKLKSFNGKQQNQNFIKSKLTYSLKLVSIISPGSLINFSILNSINNNNNKLYIKQSYMLLT